MSNEVSALKKISTQLNDRYRQFLELDMSRPSLKMPKSQLTYYLAQALNRHYLVAVHLSDDATTTMTGYLAKGPKDTYTVTLPNQKMTSLVHLSQISMIERLDY